MPVWMLYLLGSRYRLWHCLRILFLLAQTVPNSKNHLIRHSSKNPISMLICYKPYICYFLWCTDKLFFGEISLEKFLWRLFYYTEVTEFLANTNLFIFWPFLQGSKVCSIPILYLGIRVTGRLKWQIVLCVHCVQITVPIKSGFLYELRYSEDENT